MKSVFFGASITALAAAIAAPAFAGADAAAASTGAALGATSEVIVTGTRVTGVKAVDSAAPIQLLGSGALKRVAQPDLIAALAQNLPSFNAEALGGDLGNLTKSASLRGLSPNDTLVLVDGKRRHDTGNLHVLGGVFQGGATTDLSLIPVGAIDHIEVLQDGAAAQYGTDAIAGVINIILKTNDHAGSITGTGGQYYYGDGDTGAWSINKGFALGEKGFVNLTAEEQYHDFSQRGDGDRRVQNPDGSLKSSDNAIDAAGVPGASGFPRINKIEGDSQFNLYNLFYNAGYDLTDQVQAYSYGSFSHRKAASFENYRVPSKIQRTVNGVTSYPFPNGFDPEEGLVENDYSFTDGIKGAVAGWNWDLSTTYGQDKDQISTLNSANGTLYANTGFTPTDFYDGAFTATQWTSNLDLSRSFAVGLASPLDIAFGAEARRESYTINHGDAASFYGAGAQSFPGFQATDAGTHRRTDYAGYVDLAADVIHGLHVDLAGRYETYSDFGDTTVGKLTARYDINPMIAIRGTVSTGFRAPTLQEEYYSATNVSPSSAVVQLPANSPAAAIAGFSPLRPEKSDNYSIGFVVHPIDKLQITVDAYEIDIRDRILATGFLLGSLCTAPTNGPCPAANYIPVSAAVNAAIAGHGNRIDTGVSYTGISIFTNGANTRTQGAELTANYPSDFGDLGHVDWSAGFNYNETTITKQAKLPAAVTNAAFGQTTILTPSAISDLTKAPPKDKLVLGAFYTHAKWSVNLRETIYGPSSEIVSTSGTGVNGTWLKIDVTGITDLDVGYQLTNAIKLNAGANNLFDKNPPTVPNVGGRPIDGGNVYNHPYGFSPWGINGGYYYGRVTFTF